MSREDEYRSIYFEETREHLEKIEAFLLDLQKDPEKKDCINDLFRSVHTIKGSSAAMGYTRISDLVHKMEDIIQAIRDGKMAITIQKLELFLKVYDFLSQSVEMLAGGGSEDLLQPMALMEELIALAKEKDVQPSKPKSNDDKSLSLGLVLDLKELEEIKTEQMPGHHLLGVLIKTQPDSTFKTVRTWMALEEVQRNGTVIASNPTKAQIDDYMRKDGEEPPEALSVIMLTYHTCQEMASILTAELSEVDLLHIEELQLKRGTLVGDFLVWHEARNHYAFDEQAILFSKLDLSSAQEGVDEGDGFRRQGFEEIIKTTKDLELLLLDMCPNLQECKQNCNHVPHLITGLVSIQETAMALEDKAISQIAEKTAEMLGCICSGNLCPSENVLDLAANSFIFIKKTARCNMSGAQLPEDLLKEIEAHLSIIHTGTVSYIEKHIPKPPMDPNLQGKRLCEILVDKGILNEDTKAKALDIQKQQMTGMKMGEILVNEEIANISEVRNAITSQEVARTPQPGTNFVRIPEQKIGSLFDLLGELIIMQSQQREDVQAVLNGVGDGNRLNNNMARMERVTKDIQSIAMTLRMVSIKQIFQKVLRVAMHTAKELNREIHFDLAGEETEVDRSIVEKLNDPLMHLIRNAISHGIEEDEQERIAAGKKSQGTIRMAASSNKGSVFIEVSDDGKGIDSAKILKKAIEKGLAISGKDYSEKEILNFIFFPGFSTQEQVNSISGRGVGMNVVEEEIKKVGGRVEIKTEKGKGTSFILKIPINMATINGIVVAINGQRYVLPTMSIKRIFKPEHADWVSVRGHVDMVRNRGELIHLIPIGEILGNDFDLLDHIILVIEFEGEMKALPVKEVIGKQEIVIKPLDSAFSHLGFLSGSTIMGDGSAALILDVESFFKLN